LTLAATLSGCAALGPAGLPAKGVDPLFTFPVTNNDTPYSACLSELAMASGENLPARAVGEIADKTGQFNYDENG
jgi:curli production assembly/transport component CsgG/holdfast attachment protein HfaB